MKHKKEKINTMKELQQIEENYKKYAYFYTRYLEEKVGWEETKALLEKERLI